MMLHKLSNLSAPHLVLVTIGLNKTADTEKRSKKIISSHFFVFFSSFFIPLGMAVLLLLKLGRWVPPDHWEALSRHMGNEFYNLYNDLIIKLDLKQEMYQRYADDKILLKDQLEGDSKSAPWMKG